MSRGQEHRAQSSKDFRVNTHILTTRTPSLLEKNLLELEFPPAGYFLLSRSLSQDLPRMDIKIQELTLNCPFSVDNLSSFSGCFKQFFSSLTFFIFTIMYLPYIWVSLGVMIWGLGSFSNSEKPLSISILLLFLKDSTYLFGGGKGEGGSQVHPMQSMEPSAEAWTQDLEITNQEWLVKPREPCSTHCATQATHSLSL